MSIARLIDVRKQLFWPIFRPPARRETTPGNGWRAYTPHGSVRTLP